MVTSFFKAAHGERALPVLYFVKTKLIDDFHVFEQCFIGLYKVVPLVVNVNGFGVDTVDFKDFYALIFLKSLPVRDFDVQSAVVKTGEVFEAVGRPIQ